MKIRESIFGSKSEHKLLRFLQNRWSKQFDLWPSLPFSSIVELEKNETALDDKEREFFLQDKHRLYFMHEKRYPNLVDRV